MALKEVAEKERESQLAIISKQAELDKEERKRVFDLRIQEMNEETKMQNIRYQHEQQQKQAEFANALKQANIDKEIKLGVTQLECTSHNL